MRVIRWPVSLFNESAEQVDRHVGWDKLPLPIAMATLIGLRNRLREKNLYDTGRGPFDRPDVSDHPRYLTARTLDGTFNDLDDPLMGSLGSRFGSMRTVLLRHFPDLEPVLQGSGEPLRAVAARGGVIVRTVLGDIAPEELGACDAHEHLFLVTPAQPGDEMADVGKAVVEALTLVEAGGRALVDWTPLGIGRDLDGLVVVARETGLHVIAATGLHREVHYGADSPYRASSVDELAETFTGDLRDRCGIVKVGASYHHLTPFEEKAFAAAAEAHGATGAPVCMHTEHGTMGLAIVEHLSSLGVASRSIVLAHVDRNPDAGEHAETASTGAWLQLDGPGRTKYWPDSTILRLIGDLADRGFAAQLLLGGDTGRASMMRAYGGGPGLDYVFARFKPRLERELGAELSERIFVTNPARAFAFEPR